MKRAFKALRRRVSGKSRSTGERRRSRSSRQLRRSNSDPVQASTSREEAQQANPDPQEPIEPSEQVPEVTMFDLLEELPSFKEVGATKREALLIKKLRLCGFIFQFGEGTEREETFIYNARERKRALLLELVELITTTKSWFSVAVLKEIITMVSANLFRSLPEAKYRLFDPEEDEPVLEPAWPHLQVAYEFFLRFIVSSEVNAKAAKKYVDQRFCL
eukprot:252785_1